jgi:hypothetical protein
MERTTLDKIKKRHPNEWVLLAEPETDAMLNIKSGIVIAHSPHRSEIYLRQRGLEGNYAIEYTGEIAKNKIFVL